MKRQLFALLLCGLSPTMGFGQTVPLKSGIYESDPAHTNVIWSVKHHGASNYIGRFNGIKATLDLNLEKVQESSVVAEISVSSVDTNYPLTDKDFDAQVAGSDILDAKTHPVITFKSTSIEPGPDNTAKITGDLSFHGVTRETVLDTKMNAMINPHPITKGPVIGFSAKTMIKRSDFGVDFLQGSIGDDVPITIEIEFMGK
ncbi:MULTISPECIES: YceI family protein [Rhizobium/Agrobacterium group]|uniref:YceI family protein n=1 Tax=Rhizobium/Agrobacterium group TaxID=227290 RepID=UPI0015746175|nr:MULTISPECIES: YceI family protein [Rhizobium/Agrobacterium group]NTC82508.1 YceI family protein [Agrobacterium tumefaciens]NTD11331.1 YceI family protein [Agrobacterium tumefaciens]NTD86809.1 YceI family protein [Agrobacterium tumefaciens]NTD93034.1 YceI family protein [Agrobacterium tumefaciens]NTE00725.1 YceI family protein [Agrobacterium tumefaciens]